MRTVGSAFAMENGHHKLEERPTADLVKELAEQATHLIRSEVELAKAELAVKGKEAGIGAGMFGGAGLFAVLGLGALTAAAIAALATAMATWLAALIVAVVYFAIAGVVALMGKKHVQHAGPPVPEEALQSAKTDVEVTKARVKGARR
jgi:uncharacterized membrane protein YqjE